MAWVQNGTPVVWGEQQEWKDVVGPVGQTALKSKGAEQVTVGHAPQSQYEEARSWWKGGRLRNDCGRRVAEDSTHMASALQGQKGRGDWGGAL